MNRQGIIERVKIVLDEFTPVNQGVVHPVDTYIDPVLDDSVRTLFKDFPVDKLWHQSLSANIALGVNSMNIIIPANVVRVAGVRLSDWGRIIHEREFEAADSPKAAWQGNLAIRATIYRPLVFVKQKTAAGGFSRVLECHGVTSVSTLSDLTGVVMCRPEEVNDDLITPLVYLTASLVAAHFERWDTFKLIHEQYLKHASS